MTNKPGMYRSLVAELRLPHLCLAALYEPDDSGTGGHLSNVGPRAMKALHKAALAVVLTHGVRGSGVGR